jgi:hypothetical protein
MALESWIHEVNHEGISSLIPDHRPDHSGYVVKVGLSRLQKPVENLQPNRKLFEADINYHGNSEKELPQFS